MISRFKISKTQISSILFAVTVKDYVFVNLVTTKKHLIPYQTVSLIINVSVAVPNIHYSQQRWDGVRRHVTIQKDSTV